ncbi:MAG: type II toxin-antitoxin system Phd/YefM family antitoxin [Elusimicrobia bacterium]|nr:type II toxin-antitoxin system Phd/YefM family antitoxin [Elusimicrobiota bacterium]
MATYTLPSTEARKKLLSIVRDAGERYSRYVITHRGRPQAVVMSAEEYESWLETLEIMSSPSWMKAIAQGEREIKQGKWLSFEEVVGRKQRSRRRP